MKTGDAHVALATNHAYVPWSATAIRSCIEASPDIRIQVHLICDVDVTSEDRARLRQMTESCGGQIAFLPLEARRLSGLPGATTAHGGAISCARFLLPELLEDVDRCLYLDSDTLVITSVASLFVGPQSDAPIGAVRNVVHPGARQRLLRLGLKDPFRYMNSGVLLMNLVHLRRHGGFEQLLSYIRESGADLRWVDQDALNVVFAGQWEELHPRWNAQNSFWFWRDWAEEIFGAMLLDEAVTNPAVLHFEGPYLAKPWHYLSMHAYRHRYRTTLALTPWRGTPLEDRTWATRPMVLLPWDARVRAYVWLLSARHKKQSLGAWLGRRQRTPG